MKTKLIQTKEYLLLIDEEAEINIQDAVINLHNNELHFALEECLYKDNDCKKVIAHYPLTKETEELDLPLLPNPSEEEDIEKLAIKSADYNFESGNNQWINGFIDGYKTAQSKRFSLEDMNNLALFITNNFKINAWSNERYGDENNTNIPSSKIVEEFIQSLSTQQLSKEFIPEYDIVHTDHAPNGFEKLLKFKTNLEGKEEIQGTYKY